jgi:magnesium transporter
MVRALQGDRAVSPNSKPSASLRATLYDDTGRDKQVDLEPSLIKGLGTRQLLWVDVDSRDPSVIDELKQLLELPAETAQLLLSDDTSPHLLRYPERVHLRLVAMQPSDTDGASEKASNVASASIDIIVAPNLVVTVHHGSIHAFDAFQDNVRGDSSLGALDAADFLTILVDSILAVYRELVEVIERKIDALDEVALRATGDQSFLAQVVGLRRRVALLRRALAPHAWAFAPLARPDFELEGVGKPWPGVVDRLDRAIDAVGNARELLIGAFDVYMARSAQRTNDVMKALTVLSAILLPAVLIGGVMGMNFEIAFFDDPNNFWVAIGAMVGLAAMVVGVTRWRGWI